LTKCRGYLLTGLDASVIGSMGMSKVICCLLDRKQSPSAYACLIRAERERERERQSAMIMWMAAAPCRWATSSSHRPSSSWCPAHPGAGLATRTPGASRRSGPFLPSRVPCENSQNVCGDAWLMRSLTSKAASSKGKRPQRGKPRFSGGAPRAASRMGTSDV